jgi:hypothetical protein
MISFYFMISFRVRNMRVLKIGFHLKAQDNLHAWTKLSKDMATAFGPYVTIINVKLVTKEEYWK